MEEMGITSSGMNLSGAGQIPGVGNIQSAVGHRKRQAQHRAAGNHTAAKHEDTKATIHEVGAVASFIPGGQAGGQIANTATKIYDAAPEPVKKVVDAGVGMVKRASPGLQLTGAITSSLAGGKSNSERPHVEAGINKRNTLPPAGMTPGVQPQIGA